MTSDRLRLLNLGHWVFASEPDDKEKLELPQLVQLPSAPPKYVMGVDPYGRLQEQTHTSIFKILQDGSLELVK